MSPCETHSRFALAPSGYNVDSDEEQSNQQTNGSSNASARNKTLFKTYLILNTESAILYTYSRSPAARFQAVFQQKLRLSMR
jgi:hypothetical protein